MSKSAQNSEATKKPIFKKWWFWVIIVVVLIGIGAAASNGNDATKVGENSGSSQQQQTEFKVGDVIAYDGKEITVKSVERNWTAEYSKPSDGKEYVKVNIYIENKSDDKISYNVYDWELQDSDGDIKSQAFVVGNDDSLSSGELAKGGKKSGSIIFEVSKGDSGLVLHYKSSFWSDKTIEIKL
jgi:uncharacterized protein affecting Mg2+/Co2+ transport